MKNKFDSNYFIITSKSIIYEFDLLTASLYGLIWSYSHMKLGYCKISQSKMAEKLGVKPRTISTKFGKLKKAGLIKIIERVNYPEGGVLLHTVCDKDVLLALDEKYRNKLQKSDDDPENDFVDVNNNDNSEMWD